MVVKIIELVGTASTSFDDAVSEAVTRAAQTTRNITGVDVLGFKATVENGKVSEYRANVKIAFRVEEVE